MNCVNLLTLDKVQVLRKIGSLPTTLMVKVNDGLRAALELQ